MTVDSIITRLDAIATERYPMITNLDVDALNDAKTIIDKYQKIEKIVSDDYYLSDYNKIKDIKGVIDGNDD